MACASHDIALSRLRECVAESSGLDLELFFESTADSLRSLGAGRCLVAGVHVPQTTSAAPVFTAAFTRLLEGDSHKLISFARRTQGLMVRREHATAIRGFGDLVRSRLRFVNRRCGSGTRLLVDHLLRQHGVCGRALGRYGSTVEESHVAVAASVASGVADVGPGIKAAALEFGLHFVPLVDEDYFLACLQANLEHPAVVRLRHALAAPAWTRLLTTLPGYASAANPGTVVHPAKLVRSQ